jgi:CheY-like chemotaxis protein
MIFAHCAAVRRESGQVPMTVAIHACEALQDITGATGTAAISSVFLPCDPDPAAPGCTGTDTASVSRTPLAQASVLLVEDEDILRLSVAKMLRKHGFSVVEARDGTLALDVLRGYRARIDVVLLDVTIPGNSSREVVAEAQRIRPDIKVVLTSAYSREMVKPPLDAPQIKGFIRKPFQLAELVRVLREVLSR